MAKIVICIEDNGDSVSVSTYPPMQDLRALTDTPDACTSAHAYAFTALSAIMGQAKEPDAPPMKVVKH